MAEAVMYTAGEDGCEPDRFWQLQFEMDAMWEGMVAEALGDDCLGVTSIMVEGQPERRAIQCLFGSEPALEEWQTRIARLMQAVQAEVPTLSLEAIPPTDWLRTVQQSFKPIDAGRFYVHSSFSEEAVPEGRLAIEVDAGLAFGSGEHATTHGCLMAMDRLAADGFYPARMLDVGTGSGILAIAAAKAFPEANILAGDIDPVAVKVAIENVTINQVGEQVSCFQADGAQHDAIQQSAPYMLIVANILAGPLTELAPSLVPLLDKAGMLVLSGVLMPQAEGVKAAYEQAGLACVSLDAYGEWAVLTFTNSSE